MGSSANNGYDQIEVGYTVFAPGTGKVATSGRAYQSSNRAGPVVVGPTGTGGTSALYREQILKRAGEQAGERILRAFTWISLEQTKLSRSERLQAYGRPLQFSVFVDLIDHFDTSHQSLVVY